MTTDQKNLILATVPILKEHGVLLTTHFYGRMFKHNPELKNMFNMANQQTGKQQTALAMAVLAYAENIANPSVLMPVVDRIGHKHTSIDIRPEHYSIVGQHLIASIAEVLGDAATADILDAWTVAYNQLAKLMSGHEAHLYQNQTDKPNGWTGWRLFKLERKEMESAEICSFYLYPADGGKVPLHKPGQYISIKLFLPDLGMAQIRQYSISSAPNNNYYRISVKRETGATVDINGMISNQLHNDVNEGALVELTAPAGSFTLPDDLDAPVMFISGGVGLTPFMSMVQHLSGQQTKHPITWLHGCRNQTVHAFKDDLAQLVNTNSNIAQHIFYNNPTQHDIEEGIYEGFLDINQINGLTHQPGTRYFICGPSVFIQKQFNDLKQFGIDTRNIFFEEFGPQVLNLN
ncbi:NO-inducible flavohemoprotein [Mucilaginibacter aquariorum]|uniref:nitric oxide dioxygenase n=1 Tax=Mucilaginibacter aquariorum TaxID=2967225 RepID=A0ABT1T217_9SPHI|nr:NO-inducible flavohemoprotein [Mucilaginibacter aquariorum]MCQ6958650.1 NO-inducible flavohemoprotein [Mucilaginibacter aquariorum]